MTVANAVGALVITTGNRSESAVGYFTLYGDSCGAINPLGDLLKTTITLADGTVLPGVYGLSQWRNARAVAAGQVAPIPTSTLTKPASAELAPDQQDSDSLPPYEVLDPLLAAFLEDHASAQELAARLVADGWTWDAAVTTVEPGPGAGRPQRVQASPGRRCGSRCRGCRSAGTGACPWPTTGRTRPPSCRSPTSSGTPSPREPGDGRADWADAPADRRRAARTDP